VTSAPYGWQASAAYLYVLRLDGPSLAWEYLRRNPAYIEDWQHRQSDPCRIDRWGLTFFENPVADARSALLSWRFDCHRFIRIARDDSGDADAKFKLQSIPGRKSLLHDGRRLLLKLFVGTRAVSLAIAKELCDGEPFAYLLTPGRAISARWRAIQEYEATLRRADAPSQWTVSRRPGRMSILHMRALQAIDGRASGASHRKIAAAIFGADQTSQKWHADSELRAQVRHLVRRAQMFMHGGYQRLVLNGDAHA